MPADAFLANDVPLHRIHKRYVKKTGEIIWINVTRSIIRDPDGETLYALAMIEDVTEVKRNQEESFARQKLETVGTLANGIAHDFNNILGAVLAQAEMAMAELPPGSAPEAEEAELKTIRNVAIRGSEIVRQLMVYAGKESEALGLVDVTQIVKEMLELLKVSVSNRATLKTDLGQDLSAVRANAPQLRQIVMNLVTNASEAIGDRDGVIRVTTRCVANVEAKTITKALAECDYVLLEVSDTGCGMSLGTRMRIFDPFFTTKSEGRGLGMAVVHGIVRGLRGEIHVASEPRKGTTFQVLLPCAEGMATATYETRCPAWRSRYIPLMDARC
jgi:signal transduction histidine kinase